MRVDRINEMERYILEKGTVSLEGLCKSFHISMNTARRDLADLLERGRIQKVYGGASAVNQPKAVIPTSERALKQGHAKQVIGQLAATLVEDGMSIFVDSGTTTVCLLPHISERNNVTIITHSLPALCEAAKYPSLQVLALGGMYNYYTSSYVGAASLEKISEMSIRKIFIAATGVSLERGLTNTTYFEYEMKKIVTQQNSDIVLMADRTKFGNIALLPFCGMDRLSTVVTDGPLPQEYEAYFLERGIKLLTPGTEGQ